jgi:hypothetical protein
MAMASKHARNFKDLTGQTFAEGNLRVLGLFGLTANSKSVWLCECFCGVIKPIAIDALKQPTRRSCGCLNRQIAAETAKKSKPGTVHGHGSRGNHSPTFNSWAAMVQRCTNPNAPNYPRYGEWGVKVCPEWVTFEGFLSSMGERPEGTTLGRILDMGELRTWECILADPAGTNTCPA